jgi:hypothetical protein
MLIMQEERILEAAYCGLPGRIFVRNEFYLACGYERNNNAICNGNTNTHTHARLLYTATRLSAASLWYYVLRTTLTRVRVSFSIVY